MEKRSPQLAFQLEPLNPECSRKAPAPRSMTLRRSGGTGAWQGTYPDSTPADDRRGDFAFGGDIVLTEVAGPPPYDRRTYRIAWPGGSRDLESAGRPQLARGGLVVGGAALDHGP